MNEFGRRRKKKVAKGAYISCCWIYNPCMPLLTGRERIFLEAVSRIGYCNPFLSELPEYERQALGKEFVEGDPFWSMRVADPDRPRANTTKIAAQLTEVLQTLRDRLAVEPTASREELELYEDACLYWIYHRHHDSIFEQAGGRWGFYSRFLSDWERLFRIPGVALPTGHEPKHTFACYYQIVRAFHNIYGFIIGSSLPAARLRAAVWQSVFTHDIRRYRRTLFDRMGDFATLITGPSGTGKELVARAIALSRYVPFDDKRLAFEDDLSDSFHPLNIAALAGTLVESELFGHRRGAFTGAVVDKRGWLEACSPLGSVFLDEIGDLDPEIQVKLLRVIETRTFHPVGDTAGKQFRGKLIAATNEEPAGGDPRRKVPRGSVLPPVRGHDRDAFSEPADTRVAGGSAGTRPVHGAARGGPRGGHAGGRSVGVDHIQSRRRITSGPAITGNWNSARAIC